MKKRGITILICLITGIMLSFAIAGCGEEPETVTLGRGAASTDDKEDEEEGKYKVDYCGSKDDFKKARDSYKAGKTVTLYYDVIATDTDYSFYLDGEPLNVGYDPEKGYVIEFTMPEHDVKLSVEQRNSMEYEEADDMEEVYPDTYEGEEENETPEPVIEAYEAAPPTQDPFYGVWLTAYKEQEGAEALVDKLKAQGLDASYVFSPDWDNLNKDPYYCVTLGQSYSEASAKGLIQDAKKAGYKDAYVKYTGNRIGHRMTYTVTDPGIMEFYPDEVILRGVQINDYSGYYPDTITLVVDDDTVFDETCELEYFGNYEDGQSVLDWFMNNDRLLKNDPDAYMSSGPALSGVFEISVTGNHIDRFYGSYWWD